MAEFTSTRTRRSTAPLSVGILQRKCACGQHTGGGQCDDCKKKYETLQRYQAGPSRPNGVPPIVHDVLRSPGQPLDPVARDLFEPRFGHDFTQVRVHADAKAAESARAVNALAYTVGRNVVFEDGQYAPRTFAGQRLLAHELTHVIQQYQAGENRRRPLFGTRNDPFEQAAASNTSLVGPIWGPVPLIQRQEKFGPEVSGAPADWKTRVASARTSTDRAVLVGQATGLHVIDRTAEGAGDTTVNPAHLVAYTTAAPHINYDDNLERKSQTEPQLAGHTKCTDTDCYVVLGQKALKPDDFFWTRIVLNHEFDHVRQFRAHSGLKGNEAEVDAWTSTFTREFHRAYLLGVSGSTCYVDQINEFHPLLDYFMRQNVSATVRDNAVQRIVSYYNSTLRAHPAHSRVFRFWIHRTLKREPALSALAQRLNTDLALGVDPSAGLATTRQFDCRGIREASFPGPPTVEQPSATPSQPGATPPGSSPRGGQPQPTPGGDRRHPSLNDINEQRFRSSLYG